MNAPTSILSFLILFMSPPFSRQETVESQTLIISGPKVIFFTPTKAEVDSVMQLEGAEIADVVDEYNYAAGKAAYYLSIVKIPAVFTTSQIVVFKLARNRVLRFDRRKISDPVGMILSDGDQEPRLIAGPREDSQLVSEINRFFHIQ
jgi:hypothetical protein